MAWEATRGHAGIKGAILDSGIDMNHKDLTSKVVHQYDYVKQDNDANDERGHGTHVAGIVAANTDNSLGVAGTCPKCTLINVKVLDSNNQGGGPTGTDDRYIYAIHFAVYYQANVINMSFGETGRSDALEAAVDYAYNGGTVLVVAAGNNGTNGPEMYPAAYKNVIAVAATDQNDARAT